MKAKTLRNSSNRMVEVMIGKRVSHIKLIINNHTMKEEAIVAEAEELLPQEEEEVAQISDSNDF
jgi:hypothetical protein